MDTVSACVDGMRTQTRFTAANVEHLQKTAFLHVCVTIRSLWSNFDMKLFVLVFTSFTETLKYQVTRLRLQSHSLTLKTVVVKTTQLTPVSELGWLIGCLRTAAIFFDVT